MLLWGETQEMTLSLGGRFSKLVLIQLIMRKNGAGYAAVNLNSDGSTIYRSLTLNPRHFQMSYTVNKKKNLFMSLRAHSEK